MSTSQQSSSRPMMKAIRLSTAPPGEKPYSDSNPTPPSAIIPIDVPIPKPLKSGDIVVRVKATTVTRDNLTWPELYNETDPAYLGNDFSGIISAVFEDESEFAIGDEVYGMTSAHRGGAWAEYVLATRDELDFKPKRLGWEEAACLPMNAMTADQALFVHAGLSKKGKKETRVLITGAAGNVGSYLVQLASLAGYETVAATSSKKKDEAFLESLGDVKIIEYDPDNPLFEDQFDVVIDTVGGKVLESLKPSNSIIITIDSASYDFDDPSEPDGPKRKFFIVEPSRDSMKRVSSFVESGKLNAFVATTMRLNEARAAYELTDRKTARSEDRKRLGKGKIVLVP